MVECGIIAPNKEVLRLLWFIFVIAVCIGLTLVFSFYTFYLCFFSPKDREEDPYTLIRGRQYEAVKENILRCTQIMDKSSCEWVYTTSFDGLKLAGRYYHTSNDAPLLILFHGYRSMALRDCAGGFILGKKLGFNVLAVDQRAHAVSGGIVITFGINERYDCLSWIEYANDRFGNGNPIILSGLSMGAATVLMASALELPQNVSCIIADCPYSSPADIIRKVCRDRHLPDAIAYPFIRLGAWIYGRFDLEKTTAANAVTQASVPVLLFHGEDDRFVPCQMSRQIHDACLSPSRLCTFPGAGHGLCYMIDPIRYETETILFLKSIPSLKERIEMNDYAKEMLNNHD